jgi:hypothetical protein
MNEETAHGCGVALCLGGVLWAIILTIVFALLHRL